LSYETIAEQSYTGISDSNYLLTIVSLLAWMIIASFGYLIVIYIAKRKAQKDRPVTWPQ